MADTGWKFPGTVIGTRPSGGNETAWVNHNNIKVDDTNDATWSSPDADATYRSFGLAATNFDFSSIPAGAHIDGIEVEIGDYHETGNAIAWSGAGNHLLMPGDVDGASPADATLPSPAGTPQTEIAGAPDDPWDLDPIVTLADVQDSDFGYVLVAFTNPLGASTVSVNYIKMKIYYHEGFPIIIPGYHDPGHNPPYKSSSGNFYAVTRLPHVNATNRIINVCKATDPTGAWITQDSANAPWGIADHRANSYLPVMTTRQAGDTIHIVFYRDPGTPQDDPQLRYVTFDMSTDLYVIVDGFDTEHGEMIENHGVSGEPEFPWFSIADVRADGEVIVVYAGLSDKIMGGDKHRVDYARRTGLDTWSAGNALDAAGDIHYGNPNCALGTSNATHFIWQTTSAAPDPPTAWTDSQGRTLDSANTLSTVDNSASDTGSYLLGNPNVLSYDDGGTQIVLSLGSWQDSFEFGDGTEDGSGDLLLTATALTESISPDVFDFDATGRASVSVLTFVLGGENATDIHCLYSGGGTAGVDQDIYYTKSTDNAVTWSTPTEELDATACNFISANIYVRGSDTVLAYTYNREDASGDANRTTKYGEKILIAGGAYLPYFPGRTNILLRM